MKTHSVQFSILNFIMLSSSFTISCFFPSCSAAMTFSLITLLIPWVLLLIPWCSKSSRISTDNIPEQSTTTCSSHPVFPSLLVIVHIFPVNCILFPSPYTHIQFLGIKIPHIFQKFHLDVINRNSSINSSRICFICILFKWHSALYCILIVVYIYFLLDMNLLRTGPMS